MLNMTRPRVTVGTFVPLINTWYSSVVDFVSGRDILQQDDDHDTLDVKTVHYPVRNYLQLAEGLTLELSGWELWPGAWRVKVNWFLENIENSEMSWRLCISVPFYFTARKCFFHARIRRGTVLVCQSKVNQLKARSCFTLFTKLYAHEISY